jgi:hypothetical protein
MADAKLQRKLVDHLQDAHAMEQTVSTMLDSMIATTDDPEITEMLKQHKRQTQEHERRLRERLDDMGAGASTTKSVGGFGRRALQGRWRRDAHRQAVQERSRWLHDRAHGDSRLRAPRAPGQKGRRRRDDGGGAPKPGRRAGDGEEDRVQLGEVFGPHAGEAGLAGPVSLAFTSGRAGALSSFGPSYYP